MCVECMNVLTTKNKRKKKSTKPKKLLTVNNINNIISTKYEILEPRGIQSRFFSVYLLLWFEVNQVNPSYSPSPVVAHEGWTYH